MDDRPFALGEFELEAKRFQDQEDVGEEDGGVDAQPLGRGDRHRRGQLGAFAQLEERDLGANRPVFGHVTAGLPHQPDRRDIGRLATARLEEWGVPQRRGIRDDAGSGKQVMRLRFVNKGARRESHGDILRRHVEQ